ncbi:MAG: hypothetical protein AAF358_13465 [Pseudomonadota bacterium]
MKEFRRIREPTRNGYITREPTWLERKRRLIMLAWREKQEYRGEDVTLQRANQRIAALHRLHRMMACRLQRLRGKLIEREQKLHELLLLRAQASQ